MNNLNYKGLDLYDWYAGKYREFSCHGTDYAAIEKDSFDDYGYPAYRVLAISKEDVEEAVEMEEKDVPVYEAVFEADESNTWMDDVGFSHFAGYKDEYDEPFDMDCASYVSITGGYFKIA